MIQTEATRSTDRDPAREGLERVYYRVLEWIYLQAGEDGSAVVSTERAAEELSLTPETVFRAVVFLASHGYLECQWPESHVSITQQGSDYVQQKAWRRQTVRSS